MDQSEFEGLQVAVVALISFLIESGMMTLDEFSDYMEAAMDSLNEG